MDKTHYAIHSKSDNPQPGVPCPQPPFGAISAIDLDTRKIVWQVRPAPPNGCPPGMKPGLPLAPGRPTHAGSSMTAGGQVFHAATQDDHLQACDVQTGEPVWKYPLPVGASATPMSYPPVDHRQYVVISVGGMAHSMDVGAHAMAFALKK